MVNVHLHGPQWFLGTDASLEALAALTAFFVAFAAYRIYRMTKEKKYAWFMTSFVLLTLSFLSRALTDAILEELVFKIPSEVVEKIFYYGYVAHILLALIAYLILIIVTHKITDKRIIMLLLLTLVPSLLLSGSYYLSFYGLSTLFLAFVTLAYYQNYRKVRAITPCLVFVSFLLITLAQAQFLFDAVRQLFYVSAQITQAAGYLVLAIALLAIRLKSNEKVKTRHRV